MPVNKRDPTFQVWRSEKIYRLHTTLACFLGLGLDTFILVIGFTLFKDKLGQRPFPNFQKKSLWMTLLLTLTLKIKKEEHKIPKRREPEESRCWAYWALQVTQAFYRHSNRWGSKIEPQIELNSSHPSQSLWSPRTKIFVTKKILVLPSPGKFISQGLFASFKVKSERDKNAPKSSKDRQTRTKVVF